MPKHTHTRRLNIYIYKFLNNKQVTEEIKREIKKNPRNKSQWKHDDPNLCDKAKTVLRGKFIAIQSYF